MAVESTQDQAPEEVQSAINFVHGGRVLISLRVRLLIVTKLLQICVRQQQQSKFFLVEFRQLRFTITPGTLQKQEEGDSNWFNEETWQREPWRYAVVNQSAGAKRQATPSPIAQSHPRPGG